MLDTITDNLTQNVDNYEDTNKSIGNRVKSYTLVCRYFDNFLRFRKSKFIFDYVVFIFIGMILTIINISKNGLSKDTPTIKILVDSWESWEHITNIISVVFINNWGDRINSLLKEMDITSYISFYPIQKVESSFTLSDIPNQFIECMIFLIVVISLYFLVVLYQYYSSKQLFNSTLINMYVPKIFLTEFSSRDELGYFYIRLLRHQKNKNIHSTQSKTIITNLFKIDTSNLTSKDKFELELIPKKLFWFWDYYQISYKINDKSSINEIKSLYQIFKEYLTKKTKKSEKKELKVTPAAPVINNDIEERINEVLDKVEDSSNNELELIEIEKLESLDL